MDICVPETAHPWSRSKLEVVANWGASDEQLYAFAL